MAVDRGKVAAVVWPEVFPWLNLVTALRLALNPRALMLAALAWVAVVAGWRLCGAVFLAVLAPDPHSHLAYTITESVKWPWERGLPLGGWWQEEVFGLAGPSWWATQSPIFQAHTELSAPFFLMFGLDISVGEFFYLLICGLWALAIWALFGGAISRMAAVALAREETLPWTGALEYALRKWPSYFSAPLFPMFGVALAAVPLAIFGLLLRGDFGLMIAGGLWFLVLLGGLFMAILLVGLFFGFPLMWATISAEGTDAFDALSRTYAYTYQRPLIYALYAIAAGVLGILGWLVVAIFTTAVTELGAWGVSWLSGSRIDLQSVSGLPSLLAASGGSGALDADVSSGVGALGLNLIRFWIDLVFTLGSAFVFSYFWTSLTAIYFLLRRHVDATEMDEVYVPEEQEHGLPPLERDAHGVAGVADQASGGAPADPGPKA